MIKNPISILQELTVQRKIAPPDYQSHGTGQPHCMSFTCHVKVGTQSAVGSGSTKKCAKTDAAHNMLKLLEVEFDNESEVPSTSLLSDTLTLNYIGKLNEFCAGHRDPQPTYTDSLLVMSAQFCVVCTLKQFETKGYGNTKKEAKQNSAKKMLELIQESNLENTSAEVPVSPKLEAESEPSEQELKKYTELMENMSVNDNEKKNIVEPVRKEEANISTWNELTEFLEQHGHTYELSTFQEHPLILCLKLDEHELMEYGHSRDEILGKFVKQVADLIINGIDFSKSSPDL